VYPLPHPTLFRSGGGRRAAGDRPARRALRQPAVPIASLAKIMTADIVLRGRPLPAAGPGPVITVTAADAAAYASDERQGQSVVQVAAGEKLTERQALEAMLIPSVNNIASLLARWDASSEAAFVAKMNTSARQLG